MTSIHPTAIIEDGADIGSDVEVGAYSVVGSGVKLSDGVRLHSHVVVGGRTQIGAQTEIFPFASIGLAPQDLKYGGEESELIIGARTKIREHVTMNPGTAGGGLLTRVGDDCLFMVGSHVAHDCLVGNHVILANNATLAGHVSVGDFAIIGGLSAVHQFVRIGAHAMIGGMSGIEQDLIPYGQAQGDRARLRGLNLVGLQRRDFSRDGVNTLRTAYRLLFAQEGTMQERVDAVVELYGENEAVMEVVNFVREESSRAILQPKTANGG
jgi:UDP-N-acetylglucosamine acyltransferase